MCRSRHPAGVGLSHRRHLFWTVDLSVTLPIRGMAEADPLGVLVVQNSGDIAFEPCNSIPILRGTPSNRLGDLIVPYIPARS